mgnify:CR=1 FL=1
MGKFSSIVLGAASGAAAAIFLSSENLTMTVLTVIALFSWR